MYPWLPFATLVLFAAALLGIAHFGLRRLARGPGLGWKTVGALMVLLTVGFLLSRKEAERSREEIQSIVGGMAPTYALGMFNRGIAKISIDTQPDDAVYLDLIRVQKEWLAANPWIADIYVMGKRPDGQIVLLVDSETDYDHNGVYEGEREQRTAIGEPYEEDSEALSRAFNGESIFQPEPVVDRWGSWISSYVPIRDADGNVIDVLGVDFPAARWEHAVSGAAWGAIAESSIGVMFVIAWSASFKLWRSAISREREETRKAALARSEAEAQSQAKGDFLAHMTHELRTPMTAIQGHADLLVDPSLSPSERESALRTIRSQCDHLLDLVGDVLDLSKIEAGRMKIEPGECSIIELANDVVNALRPRASEKGTRADLAIEFPVPERLPWKPTRLRQVLLNLMGNAIKFTHQGNVTLRVAFDRAMSELAIEVIDTGVGMTPEQSARLFRPYVQATDSTSSKYGGTGLGLVISKHLVQLLGGDIRLTSRQGEGTRVRIVLPIPSEGLVLLEHAPQKITPATTAPLPPSSPSLRGRILLAEDSPDIQRLLRLFLEKAGADVTTFDDGKVVFEAILSAARDQKPFDLVLLDMNLNSMNGFEVVRALRKEGYQGVVCALTARSMPGDREACLAAGCNEFLTKPIERHRLIQKCSALLSTPASEAA